MGDYIKDFFGNQECKIDAKNRIVLPSVFRKQLKLTEGDVVVIGKGFEHRLIIYPKAIWDKEIEEISTGISLRNRVNRKYYRHMIGNAGISTIDSLGKISIPKSLIAFAKINSLCILTALQNKIEIVSKEIADVENEYSDEIAEIEEQFFQNRARLKNGSKESGINEDKEDE